MENMLDVFSERLAERGLYIGGALEEVITLLNGDKESIELFFAMYYVAFLFHSPESAKKEQGAVREAKSLKNRISEKACELAHLLNELESVPIMNDTTSFRTHTLDLILRAAELEYKQDPVRDRAERTRILFDKFFKPKVVEVLTVDDFEGYSYCPDMSFLLLAMHDEMESKQYTNPAERQASPKAMLRVFFCSIVGLVNERKLPDAILNITPSTVADLTNAALSTNDDNLVLEENVRKVISEARTKYKQGQVSN